MARPVNARSNCSNRTTSRRLVGAIRVHSFWSDGFQVAIWLGVAERPWSLGVGSPTRNDSRQKPAQALVVSLGRGLFETVTDVVQLRRFYSALTWSLPVSWRGIMDTLSKIFEWLCGQSSSWGLSWNNSKFQISDFKSAITTPRTDTVSSSQSAY